MVNLKSSILFILVSICHFAVAQESPVGAYEMMSEGNKAVLIVAPEFYSIAIFNATDHSFVGTEGGAWSQAGDGLVKVTREFNTQDTGSVGVEETIPVTFQANSMTIDGNHWTKLDDGNPGKLSGAWLFSGRKRDGELQRRAPSQRKTMKILSGTRFQWIAYHTGTKAFSGTGGGTYTTENGKYVETIDFFSRDNSRVGAVLPFDFEIKEGEWHHSGLSSKGVPMYELWGLRPL